MKRFLKTEMSSRGDGDGDGSDIGKRGEMYADTFPKNGSVLNVNRDE